MKKFVSMLCVLSMLLFAFAASAESSPTIVYVTISNGTLVLVQQSVEVTDIDEDGILTINDVLYLAHETAYEGGAQAGYASADSEWGLSLTKLWGVENGGSYGYYVNNTMAMGLADPVADGDCVNAFVYTDTEAFSDVYCWFNISGTTANEGDELTLTLTAAGFDENWVPVVNPVEGAVITINGEATDCVTDSEGKVTLTVGTTDTLIVSAVSESCTLVPPACVINGAVEEQEAA